MKSTNQGGREPYGGGGALVLFPGALGDAVCLEPAIAWLARAHGRVSIYARGGASEVARLFPARPELRSLDAPEIASLFAPIPARASEPGALEAAPWLAGYESIVSFTGASVAAVRDRLEATGRARLAPFPSPAEPIHATDYFLRWASGVPSLRAPAPRLVLGSEGAAGAAVRCLSREGRVPVLAVQPGAGAVGKRAPRDLLAGLVARWRSEIRGEVAVLLGPAETAREGPEWIRLGTRVLPSTIGDLAGAIAAATAFVGNDSGPSHLAAALGVGGVALFVTTPIGPFAPRGDSIVPVEIDPHGDPEGALEEAWRALRQCAP